MPIYEFNCEACHQEFESLQKINDISRPPCPYCGGTKVERIVSAPGFQLKGSGWYVTDFKDSKKTSKDSDKTTKTDASPKETKKND